MNLSVSDKGRTLVGGVLPDTRQFHLCMNTADFEADRLCSLNSVVRVRASSTPNLSACVLVFLVASQANRGICLLFYF